MRGLHFAIAILVGATTAAQADCPLPTPADAGKLCIVQADGSAAWSDAIKVDEVGGTITHKFALKQHMGMICADNNQRCLSQVDANGNEQNFFYLDNAQNIAAGPGHDRGVTSFVRLNADNFFLNDTTYNFDGSTWPSDKLTLSPIGAGCSVIAGGDNNMRLRAPPGAGSGCLVMSTNRHTNTSYPFALNFLLAVDDDTYTDLQFGVRDASGNSQIRFRLGTGSGGSATLDCTITNGGATHTISTSWGRGTDRRVFNLFFPPSTSGEAVELMPSNGNNEYIDASPACNFPLNDAAMPSGLADLYAFVQFRNYDPGRSRALNLGKIRFRSGF